MRDIRGVSRLQAFALLAGLGCAASSSQPSAPNASPHPAAAAQAGDRAELLRLHERQRTAHVQRRADWLVEEWADSLFSVNCGRVSVGRKEPGKASFQQYLDAVTFQAWDDIVPPRIRISPDGQMAYVIVEKRVHLTPRGAKSGTEAERTRFAWLSVYEKRAGRWQLAAIASTERPDSLQLE
ncbi:MAG TPA: nuclear transport factor 2 family protein [Gemmatimonadales bacterium]|nr:nuclear transport factor 2 family protein [Gemmatimonadales bacterium]